MGILISGNWVSKPENSMSEQDLVKRDKNTLRNWISLDGKGFTSEVGFAAEPNRYHLYISKACPFAHRTSILRHLKGLEDIVSMSEVEPTALEDGWVFSDQYPDPLNGKTRLHEIYAKSNQTLSSRVSVPVLWDTQLETIVSNDSGDIMRMFNSAFDRLTGSELDFYPTHLRFEIDDLNDWLYNNINVGVYRAGFAKTDTAYQLASKTVFEALDSLEERLDNKRFLLGDTLTESDWRIFTTLVRFDAVYHSLFKLNQSQLADYYNLSAYVRDLYQHADVRNTVDLVRIKEHYFSSFTSLNPSSLIPTGGETDFSKPHYRVLPEGMEKQAC